MSSDSSNDGTLGRIALKQVRVRRKDVAKQGAAPLGGGKTRTRKAPEAAKAPDNPLNRLVPYLDLFGRLEDRELARLSRVAVEHAAQMRAQVDEIAKSFARYVDLVDRLSEEEFVRLTAAPPKTVRFWLLCQPRTKTMTVAPSDSGTYEAAPHPANDPPSSPLSVSPAPVHRSPTPAPVSPAAAPPGASGVPIEIDDDDDDDDDFADFDPSEALVDDDDDDDFF